MLENYPKYAYSFTNYGKTGKKMHYHCSLSKYHLSPHCGHTLMIYYYGTRTILHENETIHSHHNNEKVDSIGDKEKAFFSENFDKGICTGGALIRLLRSHNET